MYIVKSDLYAFSKIVSNVRCVVDIYFRHIQEIATAPGGDGIITPPSTYVLVRAIETLFYEEGFDVTLGTCLLAWKGSKSSFIVRPTSHEWLTWKNKYIIDVLPLDGMFGISLPQPVLEKDGVPSRFSGTPGLLYKEEWSDEVRAIADKEVEELAEFLEELLQKAPL